MNLNHGAALVAAALAGGAASAQSTLFNLPGGAAGDGYGFPTRTAPDLDGDGIGDLIVGSQAGITGTGYVDLVSGASGTLLRTLASGVPGDWYGTAVAGLADVTGDGLGPRHLGD